MERGERLTQTQDERNSGVLSAWFPHWVINTFLNYKQVLEEFQDKDMSLMNLPKPNPPEPAVIVGSGPSLDKTAPFLKDWKGAVFCSASNVFVPTRWGHKPKYLCVFDAGGPVNLQLRDYDCDDTYLLTHPAISPMVMQAWAGEKRYYTMLHKDHNWFEVVNPLAFGPFPLYQSYGLTPPNIRVTILNAGCSVNNQIQIAHWMQYDPLFLIGVDFGYPENKHRCTDWRPNDDGSWKEIPPPPELPDRPIHTSDNGIPTTEEQIDYKVALMAVWKLDQPQLVDCSGGIITELPKANFEEVVKTNGRPEGLRKLSKEEIVRISHSFLLRALKPELEGDGDRADPTLRVEVAGGDGGGRGGDGGNAGPVRSGVPDHVPGRQDI